MRNLWFLVFLILLFPALLLGQTTWTETSDAHFDAGSFASSYREGAGDDARVLLDYYGRGAGLHAPGPAAWFDPSWRYRAAITVTSTNTATLPDYRMPFTIDTQSLIVQGRMKADGSDIRFSTAPVSGNAASLPYCIESGLNTASTLIWVRIPAVRASTTTPVYMYYGNASASAVTGMGATFTPGDDFTGTDGSSPSTATWANTQYQTPVAGSARGISGNRLRLTLGSSGGTKYYGLRSKVNPSFNLGMRYHAAMEARIGASDTYSLLTLCPVNTGSSPFFEEDWLRLVIRHSASGPVYAIEKKVTGIQTTMKDYAGIAEGFHDIELILDAGTLRVLIDGSQVYAAAHGLAFSEAYVFLEAASSSSSLYDFQFDNVFASALASPEPAAVSGQGEGRYYSSGSYDSAVFDSGSGSTRYTLLNWISSATASAALTVQARAHNADMAQSSFSAVTIGSDPGLSGRYFQYRLAFSNTDVRYSAALSSITCAYSSPPGAPASSTGTAAGTAAITWGWTDASSGQCQEEGFRLADLADAVKNTVAANTTWWTETGLFANTQYARTIEAFNVAGSSRSPAVSCYTLPVPPNVSCDRSTDEWYAHGSTFTFTNEAGFGVNGVSYYRYAWTAAPAHVWTGAEPSWSAGVLRLLPAASGDYYLHVKSFNGDHASNGVQTCGPYRYDALAPQIADFTPDSSGWTNAQLAPSYTLSDAGGSALSQARSRWTAAPERPVSGWSAWDGSMDGSGSGVLASTVAAEGSWYLHVEAMDGAGNTGYAFSGPYRIDLSSPTGGVTVNAGALFTYTQTVALELAAADALSGVRDVNYRNAGGGWSATEPFSAGRAWTLSAGEGGKTVEYLVSDNAGNFTVFSDTIVFNNDTQIAALDLDTTVSGDTSAETEILTARATFAWAPTAGPVQGSTITFVFNGVPAQGVTDAFGVATATYTVPAASGTYTYSAAFPGDGVFDASSDTSTIAAIQRPTILVADNIVTTADTEFTARATFRDHATLSAAAGRTITFNFNDSIKTAVTDAVGVATVTYVAPASTAVYTYNAAFAGDATYAVASDTASLAAGMKLTSLVASDVSTIANAQFTAQARLKDNTGADLAGKTVTFVFEHSTVTATTNGVGIATVTYSAPLSSGGYVYTARFDGDAVYYDDETAAQVSVDVRPVNMTRDGNELEYVLEDFSTWARIVDGTTGAGVEGRTVTFVFEGQTRTVATDAAGVSTATFACGSLARSSTCHYYFYGDQTYGLCSATAPVAVNLRPTAMAPQNVTAVTLSTFTAQAALNDTRASRGVEAAQVVFCFNGSSITAVTDASGVASAVYDSPAASGTYSYTATFLSSGTYASAVAQAGVTVNPRATVTSAFPRWIYTLQPFTALAELRDGLNSATLDNRELRFVYDGVTNSTMTDSQGRGYAVYPATSIAGTYSYAANFPGNASFLSSTGTASVYVYRRPANLAGYSVAVAANNVFTVTGELKDGISQGGIAGETISFVFMGSTQTATTDGAGMATANFTAPSSTGTYSYSLSFAQNDAYEGASSSGTVAVTKRIALLTAFPKVSPALESLYLRADLYDAQTLAPVAGATLRFVFRGSTITAQTDADGAAWSAAFPAVSTAAVYSYMVSFDGSGMYAPVTSTSTVTIELRNTAAITYDSVVLAGSTFTARADLQDGLTSAGLALKTMSFLFEGAAKQGVTETGGVATVVYTAPLTTGTYSYNATFGGDVTYAQSSSTSQLTVIRRPVVVQVSDISVLSNSTFTATAVLRDFNTGTLIDGRALSFVFLSSTRTALTNALGSATTTYTAPSSSATYTLRADFDGDSLYEPASGAGSVVVGRRPTTLVSFDVPSAVALDTFTVTARLRDTDTGGNLQDKTLTFVFLGSTKTAATNSVGIATTTFLAPATVSTYTFIVSFAGDSLYAGNNSLSSVFVQRRPTVFNAQDLTSIPALSTFTVTGDLRDAGTGLTIATGTVTFVFGGSTRTAVTDAVGVASAAYSAPPTPGSYSYTAAFDGDALYAPCNDTALVSVIQRPTFIEAANHTGIVGMPCDIEVCLKDFETGAALASKTVRFVFEGSTTTAATGGVGIASTTFTAPASTGSYVYRAFFDGDVLYASSTGLAHVNVGLRPTIFSVTEIEIYALDPFNARATLRDGLTGDNISGREVTFTFQSVEKSTDTSAEGVAAAVYNAPTSSGTYVCYATFAGDTTYEPNASQAFVTVNRRPTIAIAGNPWDAWSWTLSSIGIAAKLVDGITSNPISSKTLHYYCMSDTRTSTTDASGVATGVFLSTSVAGNYPYSVEFKGDATYATSSDGANAHVERRWTSVFIFDADTTAFSEFSARAKLLDTVANPDLSIAGRTMKFLFQGSTKTAVTDGDGIAVTTFTAPGSVGVYQLKAWFDYDQTYWNSSSTGPVNVGLRATTLVPIPDPVVVGAGKPFETKAKLLDLGSGLGVGGKTVEFVFQGQTLSGVTDAVTGIATVGYTAPLVIDTYTFTARFYGDTSYAASQASGTVIVEKNTTILAGETVTVEADDSFFARATLTLVNGSPVPGKTIDFVFESTDTFNASAVTDGTGLAQVAFTAPLSTGTYNFKAFFAEDADNKASSDTVNAVTVIRRRTATAAAPLTVYVGDPFALEAALTDWERGNGLGNKPMLFLYHGSVETSSAAVTWSDFTVGKATAVFSAPSSSGAYSYAAVFPGDSLYDTSSDTRTVTINRRVTALSGESVSSQAGAEFAALATLSDITPTLDVSTAIAGRTVEFVFQGQTVYGVTDELGIATATFTAPLAAGSYNYTVTFPGDIGLSPAGDASNTLTVLRRPTTLTGEDVNTSVGVDFLASGTLIDSENGSRLPGRTLTFVFESTSTITRTAVTNSIGIATVTYCAPISTGVYNYSVSFGGDVTYEPSSDTENSVTVNAGSTTIRIQDVSTYIDEGFTADANLTGTSTGAPVPGKTVRFVFQGSTRTAATDAFGVALSTFAAPSSSGTYRIDAHFDGDTTYIASSSAAFVTVRLRPSQLAAPAVNTYTLEVFYATATLTDSLSSTPAAGRDVSFVFQNATHTATTNGIGIATTTFNASTSSGTYVMAVFFDGDTRLAASSTTCPVVINPRPTSFTMHGASVTVTALEVFYATATLRDTFNNQPVPGTQVRFLFEGVPADVTTNAVGVATAAFTAPSAAGACRLDMIFAGNATYAASGSTGTVNVLKRPTSLAAPDVATSVMEVFHATATLRDAYNNQLLPGKSVRFVFEGVTHTVTTNGVGIATTTFTSPASSGTFSMAIAFDGNETYVSTATAVSVLVVRHGSLLELADTTAAANEVFSATATLRDQSNLAPASGRTVRFVFGGSTQTAVTDGSGRAFTAFVAPSSAGAYRLDAYFDGDSSYFTSSASSTVTVSARPTSIYAPSVVTIINEVFAATATLRDVMSSNPVADGTVRFVFQSTTHTAVTDGSGMATVTFTAPPSSGTYTLTAAFDGTPTYLSSATVCFVAVDRNPAVIAAGDVSTMAQEVFLATATLRNPLNSQPIPGKTLNFVFNSTTHTVTTNGVGVATATFTAPAASGSLPLIVRFAGDAGYNDCEANAAVSVTKRPAALASGACSTLAMEVFVATATLRDAVNAQPIAGGQVSFMLAGTTQTAFADAVGIATVTFTAPAAVGTYQMDIAYAGDATFLSASTNTAVYVTRRPITVGAAPASVMINEVFVASSTLRDGLTGQAASGRALRFVFNSATHTVTANEIGVATATFTAPVSSGTYQLYSYFDGDEVYMTASSASVVTVLRRPSGITAGVVVTTINEAFAATASLRDALGGQGIGGRQVRFVFAVSTHTVTTNASGIATTTFTAPASSGTYPMIVAFDGDGMYLSTGAVTSVDVLRRPSVTAVLAVDATAMEVFTATATLKDGLNAQAIEGRAVSFVFNGDTHTVTTDGAGVAVTTFTAQSQAGQYPVRATFEGDASFFASSGTAAVNVAQRPADVEVDAVTVTAFEVFHATAALRDSLSGQPLENKNLRFVFDGTTRTVATDSLGIATAPFSAPAVSGMYQLHVQFDGDTTYAAGSATGTVQVLKRPSMLSVQDVAAYVYDVFVATAVLRDAATLAAVPSAQVRFIFSGSTNTVLTDGSGTAVTGFNAPAASGTYQVSVQFDGDATYLSASTSAVVGIDRRFADIEPEDAQAFALDVFVATVTLHDRHNGLPVEGRALEFAFAGSTQSAITNDLGEATTTFTAPSAAGVYPIAYSFAGDTVYVSTSGAGEVNVAARATQVDAAAVAAVAMEVFSADASLLDVRSGQPVGGKALHFVFVGDTHTVVTDGSGFASTTFTAPSSSGTYSLVVKFNGDATYLAGEGPAAVDVAPRPTDIVVENATGTALEVIIATATLRDTLSAQIISHKSLRFVLDGATRTGVTDEVGVATAALTAPAVAGAYALDVHFDGDATYGICTGTGIVAVEKRPLGVTAPSLSTIAQEVFVATATVRDLMSELPVSGKTVRFVFNGSTQTAVSDASGRAAVPFTAPPSYGGYELLLAFDGDATYLAAASTSAVDVLPRPTTMSVNPATAYALDVFTATATLTDTLSGTPLAGKTVSFIFQASVQPAVTDADGTALVSYAAPAASGTYVLTAHFDGDPLYAVGESTATVTVRPRKTALRADDTSANSGEPFTVQALLTDTATGAPLADKTVTFTFDGTDRTATTNTVGFATATYVAPGTPGIYPFVVRFAGDYTYESSSATAKVKAGIMTSLIMTDIQTYTLSDFTARVKLVDVYSIGLQNKSISFIFEGSTRTAVTDSEGVAEQPFTSPVSSGTYYCTALFEGDHIYSASNTTGTVTVNRRPTTILTYNTSAITLSSFTAKVELRDVISNAAIVGKTVSIAFQGSTVTVATDAGGEARAEFLMSFSSGSFAYSTRFNGDGTYGVSQGTGIISVDLRPTTLVSFNIDDAVLFSTFAARAELKDTATNSGIGGKTLSFIFNGSTFTTVTSAEGVALQMFTSPVSTGAYAYVVSFAGDGVYAANGSSATVSVGRCPTAVLAGDLSVRSGTDFTMEARLIKSFNMEGIAGKTLTFFFNGSTVAAQTNSLGVSTLTFTAPAVTGEYPYSVSFAGDAAAYIGSSTTAKVIIGQQYTLIVAEEDTNVRLLDTFAVRATLSDTNGERLPDKTVNFGFMGLTAGAVTGPTGVAVSSFPASVVVSSAGVYNYTAWFAGDTVHIGSADAGNPVNILRRETAMAAENIRTVPGKTINAQVTLTDNVNGSPFSGDPVASKPVRFEFFNGVSTQTGAGVTNSYGIAVASFTAPSSTGTYAYQAWFNDTDAAYIGSAAAGTVEVLIDDGVGLISTQLKVRDASVFPGAVFTATAALTCSGLPVPSKPVLFEFFNGVSTQSAPGVTDAFGIAWATFTAPVPLGSYSCAGTFAGDADYSGSSDSGFISVVRFTTELAVADVAAGISEVFTASATLTCPLTAQPLAGRTVVFEFFNGVSTDTQTGVTDAQGAATAQFTAPDTEGVYAYTARFPGDAWYAESAGEGSVLAVSQGQQTFLVMDDLLVGRNEVFRATATLTSRGWPVKDRQIVFMFSGLAGVSTTTAGGTATTLFTASAATGTYLCSAVFNADEQYRTCAATAVVTVVQRVPLDDPAYVNIRQEEGSGETLFWSAVPAEASIIKGYTVEKAERLKGDWESVAFFYSTSGVMNCTLPAGDNARYYRVRTAIWDGQRSKGLVIVEKPREESPDVGNTHIHMSGDGNAWTLISEQLMEEIYGTLVSSNPPRIAVEAASLENLLLTYDIRLLNPDGSARDGFEFRNSRTGIKVSISYGQVAERGVIAAAGARPSNIAMFWHNGVEWVKLGGYNDVLQQECYVYSRKLGRFGIGFAKAAETFTLNKVAPRVFSPREDSWMVNRSRFFFENPDNSEVTIRIFDVSGAVVRKNLERESDNVMFWDGYGQDGNMVKGGIYIYQIETGSAVLNGTVVVAH